MMEQVTIYTTIAPCDEQANKKAAKRAYDEVQAARVRYGRTLCAQAQAQRIAYSNISDWSS
jgi:hypothetical protein